MKRKPTRRRHASSLIFSQDCGPRVRYQDQSYPNVSVKQRLAELCVLTLLPFWTSTLAHPTQQSTHSSVSSLYRSKLSAPTESLGSLKCLITSR